MSSLWSTLFMLLGAACLWLIIATWRASRNDIQQRDRLNTFFYQQHLKEIEQDEAQGVVADKQELITELQHRLLADQQNKALPAVRQSGFWVLIPALLLLCVTSFGLYLQTGGLMQQFALTQVRSDYPALRAQLLDPAASPLTPAQLQQFSLGLRDALQRDPDSVKEWAMLGRLGIVMNNFQLASHSLQRALRLDPNNKQLTDDYIEILVRSPDRQDNLQAKLVLQDRLSNDPTDIGSMMLLAADHFKLQEYAQAIHYWQLLLSHLPADAPPRAMIEKGIEQAKSRANLN